MVANQPRRMRKQYPEGVGAGRRLFIRQATRTGTRHHLQPRRAAQGVTRAVIAYLAGNAVSTAQPGPYSAAREVELPGPAAFQAKGTKSCWHSRRRIPAGSCGIWSTWHHPEGEARLHEKSAGLGAVGHPRRLRRHSQAEGDPSRSRQAPQHLKKPWNCAYCVTGTAACLTLPR